MPAKEYSSIGRNCRFEASFGFLQDKAVELRYLSTSPKANSSTRPFWPIAGKDAGVASGNERYWSRYIHRTGRTRGNGRSGFRHIQ